MTAKKNTDFIVEDDDFTPEPAKRRGAKSAYLALAEVALANPGRWVRMAKTMHETSVSDGRRKMQALNPCLSMATQAGPKGSKNNHRTILMRFDPNLDSYNTGDII